MVRPKPLVEIGGRPIIWHIMRLYAHYGLNDFILCVGYKGEMIKEYMLNLRVHNSDVTVDTATGEVIYHHDDNLRWRVTIADTGEETMTGGRIKRIALYLDTKEDFCLTYGDGVGNVDIPGLLAFHRSHGRHATMTVVSPPGRFGAVRLEHDRIVEFLEKPAGGEGVINGGFFVLSPAVLDLIDGDATVWEQEPLAKLASSGQLAGYHHTGFWHPMDTLRDRRVLEGYWASGNAPWKVWA
jgi:glucose-1-phosphate cytidylyltransferase